MLMFDSWLGPPDRWLWRIKALRKAHRKLTAFIQNLRRGHYELGTDSHLHLRIATAFDELAETIWPTWRLPPSSNASGDRTMKQCHPSQVVLQWIGVTGARSRTYQIRRWVPVGRGCGEADWCCTTTGIRRAANVVGVGSR